MTTCPICNKRRKSVPCRVMTLGLDSPYKRDGIPVCMECMSSADKDTWDRTMIELEKKI